MRFFFFLYTCASLFFLSTLLTYSGFYSSFHTTSSTHFSLTASFIAFLYGSHYAVIQQTVPVHFVTSLSWYLFFFAWIGLHSSLPMIPSQPASYAETVSD